MRTQETRLSSEVAERIIAFLEEGSTDVDEWARRMRQLEESRGPEIYEVLIFVLTHLDFSPARAREHWERVLRQWRELNQTLSRPSTCGWRCCTTSSAPRRSSATRRSWS